MTPPPNGNCNWWLTWLQIMWWLMFNPMLSSWAWAARVCSVGEGDNERHKVPSKQEWLGWLGWASGLGCWSGLGWLGWAGLLGWARPRYKLLLDTAECCSAACSHCTKISTTYIQCNTASLLGPGAATRGTLLFMMVLAPTLPIYLGKFYGFDNVSTIEWKLIQTTFVVRSPLLTTKTE